MPEPEKPIPPARRPGAAGPPPVSSPDLWDVAAPACAAASVGAMAAVLGSIRQLNPVLVQRLDVLTILLGIGGAWAGWWLGRAMARLGRGSAGAEALRRRVVGGLVLFAVALLAGFTVAVVGLPASRRWDMVGGALMAVLVLSAVGWGLWRLSRIFGRPDDPE